MLLQLVLAAAVGMASVAKAEERTVDSAIQQVNSLAMELRKELRTHARRLLKEENLKIHGEGSFTGALTFQSGSLEIDGKGEQVMSQIIFELSVYPKEVDTLFEQSQPLFSAADAAQEAWNKGGDLKAQKGFTAPVTWVYPSLLTSYARGIVEEIHSDKSMSPEAFVAFKAKVQSLTDALDFLSTNTLNAEQERLLAPAKKWIDEIAIVVHETTIPKPFHFGYKVYEGTHGLIHSYPTVELAPGIFVGDFEITKGKFESGSDFAGYQRGDAKACAAELFDRKPPYVIYLYE